MNKQQIKPSQLKEFEEIKNAKNIHLVGNPDWYRWYLSNGIYYPHRKPTVNEIVNNKFN